MKCSSVHLTATVSNLNRFQWFLQRRNRKNVQNRARIYLFLYLYPLGRGTASSGPIRWGLFI